MPHSHAIQPLTDRPYLSTRQLAEFLGLSKVTIELWRRQGRGPAHIRLGSRVVYARVDIDAWLAAHRRGGL
jgi:excisionase family DNA binding protein